jgi:hypothetical protein
MHSGNELSPVRAVAVAGIAILAAACGNYSNDDILFIEALPVARSLHVALPGGSGQALCAIATSDLDTKAQATAVQLNQGIDSFIALIDLVRQAPPTERRENHRGWGPWPDKNHAGFESAVTMDRTPASDSGATEDVFIFTFSERRAGDPAWSAVLTATFFGDQADQGRGQIVIHYAVFWALGINKPDDPHGDMTLNYDFSADPRHVDLEVGNPGLGLPGGAYSYDRYSDDHGQFSFVFVAVNVDGKGTNVQADTTAKFVPSGAGKAFAVYHFTNGTFSLTANVAECWDGAACINYLSDQYGATQPVCGNDKPCEKGDIANCPQ